MWMWMWLCVCAACLVGRDAVGRAASLWCWALGVYTHPNEPGRDEVSGRKSWQNSKFASGLAQGITRNPSISKQQAWKKMWTLELGPMWGKTIVSIHSTWCMTGHTPSKILSPFGGNVQGLDRQEGGDMCVQSSHGGVLFFTELQAGRRATVILEVHMGTAWVTSQRAQHVANYCFIKRHWFTG